jgi:hypothetical protein
VSSKSYRYTVSLRIWHPTLDPQRITDALGISPKRSWRAGADRQTPRGEPLPGVNRDTYWYVNVIAGHWPPRKLQSAISEILDRLTAYRAFFHELRAEGGRVELFIGWCFEGQSGDTLAHQSLAIAGDLKVDISLDIYPPTEPQNEYPITSPWDDE